MKDALKQLINNVKKNNADRKEYQNEVEEDTGNIEQSEENKGEEDKAEEETVSQEAQKGRTTWKEIKEALQLLTKTGILFYVSDHPEQLSRKSIPEGNLPSRAKKENRKNTKLRNFCFPNQD